MGHRNANRPPGGFDRYAAQAAQQRMGQAIQLPQQVQIGIEYVEFGEGHNLPDHAYPATLMAGNSFKVFGGMTKRLAVAANIMGPLLVAAVQACPDAETNAPETEGKVARLALIAADALIAMEKDDRQPKAPALAIEPEANGKELAAA